MEKVVYILGAGFSAPLGLPVMNNFLTKSKDMYFINSEKYSYFKNVFEMIKEMSVTKNYYSTDLFNIEEILSILEMQESLKGRRLKKSFINFIKDVIEYYTPNIFEKYEEDISGIWFRNVFGTEKIKQAYCAFLANIMNLEFNRIERQDYGESIKEIGFFWRENPKYA